MFWHQVTDEIATIYDYWRRRPMIWDYFSYFWRVDKPNYDIIHSIGQNKSM